MSTRSIGANMTRIRATLSAAERQLGYPLRHGRQALDELEQQIRELRRKSRSADQREGQR